MKLTVKKNQDGHPVVIDQATGKELKNITQVDICLSPHEAPKILLELLGVDLSIDIDGKGEVNHPESAKTEDGEVWLRARTLAAHIRAIGKEVPLGSQTSWEVRYSENLLKSWEGIDPDHDGSET